MITEWLTSAFPCDRSLLAFKYWLHIMSYVIIKQPLIHIKHASIRWRHTPTKISRVKMSSKPKINIERWMRIENKHTCRAEANLLHPSTTVNYSVFLVFVLRNSIDGRHPVLFQIWLWIEYFIRAKVVSHHLNFVVQYNDVMWLYTLTSKKLLLHMVCLETNSTKISLSRLFNENHAFHIINC